MELSVLDLIPILKGQSATEAFRNSVQLAQYVEGLGYKRYWIAEHHDTPGLASSAPEVLIAHIAQQTKKLRVGSGGIMLPNHSGLHIAEIFRTLEGLFPGRIDLGLGRAPGADRRAHAILREGRPLGAEDFPKQVDDLVHYFHDELPVKATPSGVAPPEIWMLGSSDFGARLAAQIGLPYAFAQHFSRLEPIPIIKIYKAAFRPSRLLEKPKAIMACHIIAADSDEEAEELALASDISMAIYITTGKSEALRDVSEAKAFGLSAEERLAIRSHFPKFVGSPATLKEQLAPYRDFVDEFMVLSMIHDQKAKEKSYRLLKEIL